MTDRKPKETLSLKARRDRDKKEYKRLTNKIEKLVYHHSPGVWTYVDDTLGWVERETETTWGYTKDYVDDLIGDEWDYIKRGDKSIWNWVKEKASGAWDWLKDGFNDITGWVGEKVHNAWDFLFDGAVKAVDWLTDKKEDIIPKIKEGLESIDGFITENIERVINYITNNYYTIYNQVKETNARIRRTAAKYFPSLEAFLAGMTVWLNDFTDLFSQGLIINEDTFVEDNLRLVALQRKLMEKLNEAAPPTLL